MLQRYAERLEYIEVFEKAYELLKTDPYLAMIYCMSFMHSAFFTINTRTKKPFNPLLNETWEYYTDKFQYVSEQVSHHPPIAACFGKTAHCEFWGNY